MSEGREGGREGGGSEGREGVREGGKEGGRKGVREGEREVQVVVYIIEGGREGEREGGRGGGTRGMMSSLYMHKQCQSSHLHHLVQPVDVVIYSNLQRGICSKRCISKILNVISIKCYLCDSVPQLVHDLIGCTMFGAASISGTL